MRALEGKRALVTGAGQGIGRAIAAGLVERGAAGVAIADISRERAEETAAELERMGATALVIEVDLRDPAQIKRMVAEAVDGLGGLDVLVNNAGIIERLMAEQTSVDTLPDDVWNAVYEVNLRAVWLATKAAAPHLRASANDPNIVNAASSAGITAYPTAPAYGASKAAVIGLTRNSAVDLSPEIRVNCFCPSSTVTPMMQGAIDAAADPQAAMRWMSGAHLLRRPGRAEEVANVACFLASYEASFVTGAAYLVDGGALAWRGSFA